MRLYWKKPLFACAALAVILLASGQIPVSLVKPDPAYNDIVLYDAALAKSPRLKLIEHDMWSSVMRMEMNMPESHFNPFPATLITHQDDERFSDGKLHRLSNEKVFCAVYGVFLYQPGNAESVFTLIGATPANLERWAKTLDQPAELVAAFVGLHELGHGFMRKLPDQFATIMADKTPGQRILISETYGDITALNALLLYYPQSTVISLARSIADYREARAEADPRHDTSVALSRWIDEQPFWHQRSTTSQAKVYMNAIETLASYVPKTLPDIAVSGGSLPCRPASEALETAAAEPNSSP